MTGPIGFTDVDIDDFCCADPEVGGCPHPLTQHTGDGCQAVFCPCHRTRRHTAGCIHQQQTGGE